MAWLKEYHLHKRLSNRGTSDEPCGRPFLKRRKRLHCLSLFEFEIRILTVNRTICLSGITRRGFTIRLKRLKARAPDFGGPPNFGGKDNFQQFCKHYLCIFVLVQRTFFYYSANKRTQ